jgi:hypothetical protein
MTQKEIDELQATLQRHFAGQSEPGAPAASTVKAADQKGAYLMAKPTNQYTAEDCKDLKSEISRVLKEMEG